MTAGADLLATLARASVEGAAMAGLVWLVCRLVPAIPSGVRTTLWWLACVKLLLALLPVPAVPG